MNAQLKTSVAFILILPSLFACNNSNTKTAAAFTNEIELKRGEVISCGNTNKQFGSVDFEISGDANLKKNFNLGVEMLHSFEYDESEKVFAKIIDANPESAMAWWGVAMSNFHALWMPPSEPELIKGTKAVEIAQSIKNKTEREAAYIDAIAAFYKDWKTTDHITRCVRYEQAMEKVYKAYPDDKEAAVFYALALDASAKPTDKTFSNQKKAASILNALYPSEPEHPGIIHYIIHTYDYPGLADLALPSARKYASVAPSSAHALHMPSHIFTRLGYWDESIRSNLESVASAKCYAEQAGIKGHWDEELHGIDYLVYAYLQTGDNKHAEEQLKYLQTFKEVNPMNFKVAYAFAAIPSRIALENKNWKQAANLSLHPSGLPWEKYPWQESILHYTRLLGAAHLKNIDIANAELEKLKQLHSILQKQKDFYKTGQVAIEIKTGEAWIHFASGSKEQGLAEMKEAVEMEDATEKHPVTPGEVLPARELLGDMFYEMGNYKEALNNYEAVMQKRPNRFNTLYGAGKAAERSGDRKKAASYYRQLITITRSSNSDRAELVDANGFLKN
jgi:tetratricopeptide (TPR) repeat protein